MQLILVVVIRILQMKFPGTVCVILHLRESLGLGHIMDMIGQLVGDVNVMDL
jgi:hypothetical protein